MFNNGLGMDGTAFVVPVYCFLANNGVIEQSTISQNNGAPLYKFQMITNAFWFFVEFKFPFV